MKPWMKVLFWLGLGGAVGFFAGQQSGYKKAKKEDETIINDAYARGREDGRETFVSPTGSLTELAESLGYIPKDEEEYVDMDTPPEMPEDYEEVNNALDNLFDDGHEMAFHPTMLIPEIVTEEQFCERDDLDEELILWYELDDVMYDVKDQKPLGPEDQANSIGIGAVHEFYSTIGGIKDEVYVVNEALGTKFRIQRIEDAFMDAVDGTAAPDDDEDDTE